MAYPHHWEAGKDLPEWLVDQFGPLSKSEDGILLAQRFSEGYAQSIYNMEVRDSDVWVVTYPKCGTTWMQEILWSLAHKMDPNMKDIDLFARAPFLEFTGMLPVRLWSMGVKDERPHYEKPIEVQGRDHSFEYVNTVLKDPRVIKSHLPFSHLPPNLTEKAKVIYVCRRPKDVIVSYYHHMMNDTDPRKHTTLEKFAKDFMNGLVPYGDYFHHLKEGWQLRNHPNVHFVWYEDMKKDYRKCIQGIQAFIGTNIEGEALEELIERTNINSMRKAAVAVVNAPNEEMQKRIEERMGKHFRKGEVNDYKNHFSQDMIQEIDAWIEKRLDGTDIVL